MIIQLPLRELCQQVGTRNLPVAAHSGDVTPGGVFVVLPAAVPRSRTATTPGGEQYLAAALEKKPFAVVLAPRHKALLESLVSEAVSVNAVFSESPAEALGELARAAFGTDAHCPKILGVTGTNGKTTETYLLEALFSAAGHSVGVLGTVNYRWPGFMADAPLTTPGCLVLHSMFAGMARAGTDLAVMEVSSHALDQARVAGLDFSGALFTNLTQDHLDYHADLEEYFTAKAALFRPRKDGGVPLDHKVCACNADDPFGRRLLAETPGRIGFGLSEPPVPGSRHLHGRILSHSPTGLRLAMRFEEQEWELASPLVGVFNAMNLLGAQAMGLAFGLAPETMKALESFTGVPGRLERVVGALPRNVFVDYAHTPDALQKAQAALRDAGFKRLITVFGCGGNRDRTKRPLMGEAVARFADIAVLTSDNPRHEDPEAIIADVLPGLASCKAVVTQPDRRAALKQALELAGPDDALLVAGKGHETYQQIKDVKVPFSDQVILRELMS